MRTFSLLLVFFLVNPSPAWADEKADKKLLASVTHPLVRDLPSPPADRVDIASIKMVVTTSSEKTQRHVRIGLNHLLGFWDLEAYRHFLIAAEADPDCPMAFWGICVSLSTPGPCFKDQRIAAFQRLRQLVESGAGTELERQLAGAIAALYSEGPQVAGALLSYTAENHRAAVLPPLLACMMLRDGYDDFGDPREGQQGALNYIERQAARHSDIPAITFYQAVLLEQAPQVADGLRKAEELLEIDATYPPYQYLVGYFRLKAGDYAGAAQALQASVDLYSSYIEAQKLPLSLTPNYHRALNLLAIARNLTAQTDAALAIGDEWLELDLKLKHAHHPGSAIMLWHNRTLSARIHISNENFKAAIKALPGPRDKSPFAAKSQADQMWHHLRQYAEGRQAVIDGKLQLSRRFLATLEKFSENLAQGQKLATERGSFSDWLRFSSLFLELEDSLRAAISEAEGGENLESARIWFKAASDKVAPLELLSPPLLSRPPQLDWAQLEAAHGTPELVSEAVASGLKYWPKHPKLLEITNGPKEQ